MSLIDTIKNIGNLGGFGEVVFTVNPLQTMTFDNATHQMGVEWAQHKIIGEKPKLEPTYLKAEEVSLDIKLSATFGINPKKEVEKLKEYMYENISCDLILGSGRNWTNVLGEFVIESLSVKYKHVTPLGFIDEMEVSVKFLEYN